MNNIESQETTSGHSNKTKDDTHQRLYYSGPGQDEKTNDAVHANVAITARNCSTVDGSVQSLRLSS